MANLRVPVNFQSPYDATSLITHQGLSTTTLCACFIATSRIDGSVVAMTSYSSDLSGLPGYPGITFKHTTGVSASKTEDYSGAQAGQMEVDVFLMAAGITEADLTAGKWAQASAVLFICNYEAPNMGQLIMKFGDLAELRQLGVYAQAEIKGPNNKLTAQIGYVTRPGCPYDLGDSDCQKSMVGLIHNGTISAVTSQLVFRAVGLAATGDTEYYKNGTVLFTNSNNNGYEFQVESWNDVTGEFTLRTPAPYLPVVGNTITATRGDQKRYHEDCVLRFNNGINFGGDPFMVTMEQYTQLPQS